MKRPEMRDGHLGEAVVSVVEHDGRYLMVRRTSLGDHLGWVFPGGMIEHGELPRDASSREVHEEAGVACRPRRKLGERIHPDSGARVQYWLCDYISGEPAAGEPEKIAEARWMTADELLGSITSDVFRPLLTHLRRDKKDRRVLPLTHPDSRPRARCPG